jgi:hypothetical protein
VKTLSAEYEKSNSAAEKMIVNWLRLESQKNRWGGGRRDQGDPGYQSCSGVMRAVFTIRDGKNKVLTSREYQGFVVRREGQVGGHWHIEDVGKYDLLNRDLVAPVPLHSPYLQCCHSEAVLQRADPPEELKMHVCVSLWVTLVLTEREREEML